MWKLVTWTLNWESLANREACLLLASMLDLRVMFKLRSTSQNGITLDSWWRVRDMTFSVEALDVVVSWYGPIIWSKLYIILLSFPKALQQQLKIRIKVILFLDFLLHFQWPDPFLSCHVRSWYSMAGCIWIRWKTWTIYSWRQWYSWRHWRMGDGWRT